MYSNNYILSSIPHLQTDFDGEIYTDEKYRIIYATDASIYREKPIGVAYPKSEKDIIKLIQFASEHSISLIPRSGGTSLAGQCVGNGLVVDVSKYLNKLIEINEKENFAIVQPGIVRDELNFYLKPYGLLFGPDTSTANRATIGGMVGNNSSGNFSIVYHTTREHILEIEAILSDGKKVVFKKYSLTEIESKSLQNDAEGNIYKKLLEILRDEKNRLEIKNQYPHPSIHRRNTGYALDLLLKQMEEAESKNEAYSFNLCPFICGSEGTLCFITKIKVNLSPLPPPYSALICSHFNSINESMRSAVFVMKHNPTAVELTDKYILDCTKENIQQQKNRFFIQGEPEAIIINEITDFSPEKVLQRAQALANDLIENNLGYAHPIFTDKNQIKQIWDLRKASLGVLSNVKGKAKPVAVVEDTAVELNLLPEYIDEFDKLMERMHQRAVHFAHAGAGEIHLRPLLDLRLPEDKKRLRSIGEDVAHLVKKYNGSLSGEHGDGRVRAEFIPIALGSDIYELLKEIKYTFDPNNIFNAGKIVDAKPMDTDLRYDNYENAKEISTIFDFSATDGMLAMAEKCNGSGDCRKLPLSGGTMCPSYQATRNEKDTTRARANVLREFLTRSQHENRLAHPEIYEILDLCISCKGCTSECPSNVDMSTMKAEFLHHYYKKYSPNLRTKLFANFANAMALASLTPKISNFLISNSFTSSLIKQAFDIAPKRSLPKLSKQSLRSWYKQHAADFQPKNPIKKVHLFCDEFINYNEAEIGIKAVFLLQRLGYSVHIAEHEESGRAALSKGFVTMAQNVARKNVAIFSNLLHEDDVLIGIEPSCILSFKDEYLKLVEKHNRSKAVALASRCMLIDEFISNEFEKGNINPKNFTKEKKRIRLHAHCHQKALSNASFSAQILSIPQNYTVENIPSGCCGMAGSFGYEKEHFEVSEKIGELVLFPSLRNEIEYDLIAATGTSCRHQIKDGLDKLALHPVEILYDALI